MEQFVAECIQKVISTEVAFNHYILMHLSRCCDFSHFKKKKNKFRKMYRWFTRNCVCSTCVVLSSDVFQVQVYVGQIFEIEAIFKSHSLFLCNVCSILQKAVFSVLSELKAVMTQKMSGLQHVSLFFFPAARLCILPC